MPYSAITLFQSESLCAVAVEVPTIVASDVTGRASVAQPGIETIDASRMVGHSDRTVPSTGVCVKARESNADFPSPVECTHLETSGDQECPIIL